MAASSYLTEEEAIEQAIQEAENLYFRNDRGAAAATPATTTTTTTTTNNQEQHTPQCMYCSTLSTDERLLRDFGLSVCFQCKLARKDEFKCISKSKAVKEYLITEDQLAKLRSATVINPRKIGWNDMKLYLVSQVKREAVRIWGSLEELEEHKKRREEVKLERRNSKQLAKKNTLVAPLAASAKRAASSVIEKEVKKQRMAALQASGDSNSKSSAIDISKQDVTLPDVFVKQHVHRFGPEEPTGKPYEFAKKCLDCSLKVTFEAY